MSYHLKGNTIIPRRPQIGTIKISSTDTSTGRYLEDVIDGVSIIFVDPEHIGINPSFIPTPVVHTDTQTPPTVEVVLDEPNNKETIYLKDISNNNILKADYFYTNIVGASLLDRVEIEDYIRNVKTIQTYTYAGDKLSFTIAKTETSL